MGDHRAIERRNDEILRGIEDKMDEGVRRAKDEMRRFKERLQEYQDKNEAAARKLFDGTSILNKIDDVERETRRSYGKMEAELDTIDRMLSTQNRDIQDALDEAERRTNESVRKYKDGLADLKVVGGGGYGRGGRSDDDRLSYSSREGSLSPRERDREGRDVTRGRDSLRDSWSTPGTGANRDISRFDYDSRDTEFK